MKRTSITVVLVIACAFTLGALADRIYLSGRDVFGTEDPRVVALRHQLFRAGFYQGDDKETSAFRNHELIRYFKDVNPPIVAFDDERYRIVGTSDPIGGVAFASASDSISNRPITVWTVSDAQINGDQAIVWVKYFRTGLDAGEEEIFLKRNGKAWIVVSTGQKWIS